MEMAIPEELGKIESLIPGTSDQWLVHIQDSHADLETQHKIRDLIQFLNRGYGFRSLIVEGASRELKPDRYHFFEEKEANEQLAELLAKQGELTGAELFLFRQYLDRSPLKSMRSRGAEDVFLYTDNLETYRRMVAKSRALRQALHSLKLKLEAQIHAATNDRLKSFFRAFSDHEKDVLPLPVYLSSLRDSAGRDLDLDLGNARYQIEYPMLVRYFSIERLERETRLDKVRQDQKKLAEWLKTKNIPVDLPAVGPMPEAGEPSFRALLEEVYRLGEGRGFRFEDYPDWTRWAAFRGLGQEMQADELMEEAAGLAEQIFFRLAATHLETKQVRRYLDFLVLEKFLNLEVNRSEFKRIQSRPLRFMPSRFSRAFEDLRGPRGRLCPELDRAYGTAFRFYRRAVLRENAFLENVREEMSAGGAKKVILIAGGFHGDGIREQAGRAGLNFVSILPRMREFDKKGGEIFRQSLAESSSLQRMLRMQPIPEMTPKERSLVNPVWRLSRIERALAGLPGVRHRGRTVRDDLMELISVNRSESRTEPPVPVVPEEIVRKYYGLRRDMLEALDLDQPGRFKELLSQMDEVIAALAGAVRQIDDAMLGETVRSLIADGKVHPHFFGASRDETGVKISVAAIRQELKAVSQSEFDTPTQQLIESVIGEITEERYDDPVKQKEMKTALIERVQPHHLRNFFPEELLEKDFSVWKEHANTILSETTILTNSWGIHAVATGRVHLRSNLDETMTPLRSRSTLWHELTHRLIAMGEIKPPPKEMEEAFTYAVDVIVRAKHAGRTLEEGEALLASEENRWEFDEPALQELYQKGKEMALKGQTGFLIRPGASDLRASFFSVNNLVAIARLVYRDLKIPGERLLEPYIAYKAAGIVMAGMLVGWEQKENIKPLRLFSEFLGRLHERYAPPAAGEMSERITGPNGILDELAAYASSYATTRVQMIPLESGFWRYEKVTDSTANLGVVISDLFPRRYDGSGPDDREGQWKAARERGLGNTLLAIARVRHGRRDLSVRVDEGIRNHPSFLPLWDTMMTPRVVLKALDGHRKKIRHFVIGDQFKGAPEWISRAFRDHFDKGGRLFDELEFASLSLPEQFLESWLYGWLHYDGTWESLKDPRVRNSEIAEAVCGVFSRFDVEGELGWTDDQLTAFIEKEVWPVYKRFFDQDVEEKRKLLAAQRMMDRDARNAWNKLPDQMKQNMIEQFWQQLPDQSKQALTELAAQQVLQQMASSFSNQPGSTGAHGSTAGAQAGAPGGQAGTAGELQAQLAHLVAQVDQLENQLGSLANQIGEIKPQAGAVRDQADGFGGQGSSTNRIEQAGKIKQNTETIQQQTHQMMDDGRDFLAGAKNQNTETANTVKTIPGVHEAQAAKNQAQDLEHQAAGLMEKIEALQALANTLKKMGGRLEKAVSQHPIDESNVESQKQGVGDVAHLMADQVDKTRGATRKIERTLHQAEDGIRRLAESVRALQELRNQQGSQPDRSGKPDSQPPADQDAEEDSQGRLRLAGGQGAGKGFGHADVTDHLPPTPKMLGLEGISKKLEEEGVKRRPRPEHKQKLFSDEDREKRQKDQEEYILEQTGLERHEYEEYQNWLKEEILDENGKTVTAEKMIEDLTNALRFLTLPLLGVRVERDLLHGPLISSFVKLAIGARGRGRRVTKDAVPVRLTFLIDRSGSMEDNPIKYARITMFILLEALFRHNDERRQRGFDPIEFEIGLFTGDDSLQISHESSRKTKIFHKERVVYDQIKLLVAGGGTAYSQTLDKYLNWLEHSQDRGTERTRKMMFAVSDEYVGPDEKEAVLSRIELAEKTGVPVFVIPVGDSIQVRQSVEDHGDRALVPDPLGAMPVKIFLAIVRHIAESGIRLDSLPARSENRTEDMNNPAAIEAQIKKLEDVILMTRQTLEKQGGKLPPQVRDTLKKIIEDNQSQIEFLQKIKPVSLPAGTAPASSKSGMFQGYLKGRKSDVLAAGYSQDGVRILTVSKDHSVHVWSGRTGKLLTTLGARKRDRHKDSVNFAIFSPDGKRILTASQDMTARIWDAKSGACIKILSGHSGPVKTAQFSRDQQFVVTASSDDTARVWDITRDSSIQLLGHIKSVESAIFSPDGKYVLTTSYDAAPIIWDAQTGDLIRKLGAGIPIRSAYYREWHVDSLNSAVFSADGSLILTASDDGSARLWDTATGDMIRIFDGTPGIVLAAIFSPDEKHILTTHDHNAAYLWDVETGALVRSFGNPECENRYRGHGGMKRTAVFSTDGKYALTANHDHTARLWEVKTCRLLKTLGEAGNEDPAKGHTGEVVSAVFLPDRSRVLTASRDGMARIWDVSDLMEANRGLKLSGPQARSEARTENELEKLQKTLTEQQAILDNLRRTVDKMPEPNRAIVERLIPPQEKNVRNIEADIRIKEQILENLSHAPGRMIWQQQLEKTNNQIRRIKQQWGAVVYSGVREPAEGSAAAKLEKLMQGEAERRFHDGAWVQTMTPVEVEGRLIYLVTYSRPKDRSGSGPGEVLELVFDADGDPRFHRPEEESVAPAVRAQFSEALVRGVIPFPFEGGFRYLVFGDDAHAYEFGFNDLGNFVWLAESERVAPLLRASPVKSIYGGVTYDYKDKLVFLMLGRSPGDTVEVALDTQGHSEVADILSSQIRTLKMPYGILSDNHPAVAVPLKEKTVILVFGLDEGPVFEFAVTREGKKLDERMVLSDLEQSMASNRWARKQPPNLYSYSMGGEIFWTAWESALHGGHTIDFQINEAGRPIVLDESEEQLGFYLHQSFEASEHALHKIFSLPQGEEIIHLVLQPLNGIRTYVQSRLEQPVSGNIGLETALQPLQEKRGMIARLLELEEKIVELEVRAEALTRGHPSASRLGDEREVVLREAGQFRQEYRELETKIVNLARSEVREIDMNDPSAVESEIARLKQIVAMTHQTLEKQGKRIPAETRTLLENLIAEHNVRAEALEGQLAALSLQDMPVAAAKKTSDVFSGYLRGHASVVTQGNYSPDGKRVVTVSGDRTARLWDAGSGRPSNVFGAEDNKDPTQGHIGGVNTAVFSPDGKRVLTASEDTTARLWDIENGRLLKTLGETDPLLQILRETEKHDLLKGIEHWVPSAVFSADGKRVLSASHDSTARIWDSETGQLLKTLGRVNNKNPAHGHTNRVLNAVFSRNGTRALTASEDFTVRIWDAGRGLLLTTLGQAANKDPAKGHTASVNTAVFSPDEKLVLTSSSDHTARLWDAQSGRLLKTLGQTANKDSRKGHTERVNTAVFSPDGKLVLTSSHDSTARIWDVESGRLLKTLYGHLDWVTGAVFSPDGKRVLTSSWDETALIWDTASGRPLKRLGKADGGYYEESGRYNDDPKQGHMAAVTSAVFSPDAAHVLTTSLDQTARIWDVSDVTVQGVGIARSEVREIDMNDPSAQSRAQTVPPASPARSETRAEGESDFDGPLEATPYAKFFFAKKSGRPVLVYRNDDGDMIWWERGPGAGKVDKVVVPDVPYNIQKIKEMLMILYRPNVTYTSYTTDGRYFVNLGVGNRLELYEKNEGAIPWKRAGVFDPLVEIREGLTVGDGKRWTNDQGLVWEWKTDHARLTIAQNSEELSVEGWEAAWNEVTILYEASPERIYAYNASEQSVRILEKEQRKWVVRYALAIEKDIPELEREGSILELRGETGLGKDENARAMAWLIGEMLTPMAGHEEMQPEELTWMRTLGTEEPGVSDYHPTVYTNAAHYGSLAMLDEAHKVPEKVTGSIKDDVAGDTHVWYERNEDGVKEPVTVPNHPRARLIFTTNPRREGIKTVRRGRDQALQRRIRVVNFDWMPPDQEIEMHLWYALREARESGLYKEDWQEAEVTVFEEKLRDEITSLVKSAVNLRLVFRGYDASDTNDQQSKLLETDDRGRYKNWHLLGDPSFKPKYGAGDFLKRPPSPRVLRNIIRHFLRFPADREHRPWSVIHRFYNFYADKDTKNTYGRVVQEFHGNGFVDDTGLPALELSATAKSFQVAGDLLVVKPAGSPGKDPVWDPVEVWVHPEASIRRGIIPKEVRNWLKVPENMLIFYQALQAKAVDRDVIFVGEQETGKSVLVKALQVFLGGPRVIQKTLNYGTMTEEITFLPHMGEGGKPFQTGYLKRHIPQAMLSEADGKIYGKPLHFGETNQGRASVLSTTHEVAERRIVTDLMGNIYHAGPGFWVLHAINPLTDDFEVQEFDDAFTERHAVFWVKPLPGSSATLYVSEAAKGHGRQVNPKLIAGLFGVEELIRRERETAPGDALPRAPGVGTWKDFVRHLVDYWLSERGETQWAGRPAQELLLDIFKRIFTTDGETDEEAKWDAKRREHFKAQGMWSDAEGEDGLTAFLDGEDVITENLGVFRKPNTLVPVIDGRLRFLQETTIASSVASVLEYLAEDMGDLYKEPEWSGFTPEEKMRRVYALKEIYQVLEAIQAGRSSPDGPHHTPENLQAIAELRENINNVLVIQRDWHESILANGDSFEVLWGKVRHLQFGDNPVLNDLFLKLNLFCDQDPEYLSRLSLTLINVPDPGTARSEAREIDMNDTPAIRAEIKRLEQMIAMTRQTLEKQGERLPAEAKGVLQKLIEDQGAHLEDLQKQLAALPAAAEKTLNAFAGPLRKHKDLVSSAVYSPDGSRIATASHDHTVCIWDAGTGQLLTTLGSEYNKNSAKGHTDAVVSVTFSLTGNHVLTASHDRTARIWDAATGRLIRTLGETGNTDPKKGHRGKVKTAIFSGDEKLVLTAGGDHTACLWDAATGRLIRMLGVSWGKYFTETHADGVNTAVFSGDEKLILTASDDATARIWSAETGKLLRTLGEFGNSNRKQGHVSRVNTAVFSGDEKLILTASDDATARIWNAETGELLRTLDAFENSNRTQTRVWRVNTAVFSGDEQLVLTASADQTVRIWDAATGRLIRTLGESGNRDPQKGHIGEVNAAIFSSDKKLFLTAGDDATARIWNAESGELLRTLGESGNTDPQKGHTEKVHTAIFSGDEKLVLTASHDKTARIWDVSDVTGHLLNERVVSFPFGARAQKAFKYLGILTLRQLVMFSRQDLIERKNVGRVTAERIEKILADMGLKLSESKTRSEVREVDMNNLPAIRAEIKRLEQMITMTRQTLEIQGERLPAEPKGVLQKLIDEQTARIHALRDHIERLLALPENKKTQMEIDRITQRIGELESRVGNGKVLLPGPVILPADSSSAPAIFAALLRKVRLSWVNHVVPYDAGNRKLFLLTGAHGAVHDMVIPPNGRPRILEPDKGVLAPVISNSHPTIDFGKPHMGPVVPFESAGQAVYMSFGQGSYQRPWKIAEHIVSPQGEARTLLSREEKLAPLIRKKHRDHEANSLSRYQAGGREIFLSLGKQGLAYEYVMDGKGAFRALKAKEEILAPLIRRQHSVSPGNQGDIKRLFTYVWNGQTIYLSLGGHEAYEYTIDSEGRAKLLEGDEEKLARLIRQEYSPRERQNHGWVTDIGSYQIGNKTIFYTLGYSGMSYEYVIEDDGRARILGPEEAKLVPLFHQKHGGDARLHYLLSVSLEEQVMHVVFGYDNQISGYSQPFAEYDSPIKQEIEKLTAERDRLRSLLASQTQRALGAPEKKVGPVSLVRAEDGDFASKLAGLIMNAHGPHPARQVVAYAADDHQALLSIGAGGSAFEFAYRLDPQQGLRGFSGAEKIAPLIRQKYRYGTTDAENISQVLQYSAGTKQYFLVLGDKTLSGYVVHGDGTAEEFDRLASAVRGRHRAGKVHQVLAYPRAGKLIIACVGTDDRISEYEILADGTVQSLYQKLNILTQLDRLLPDRGKDAYLAGVVPYAVNDQIIFLASKPFATHGLDSDDDEYGNQVDEFVIDAGTGALRHLMSAEEKLAPLIRQNHAESFLKWVDLWIDEARENHRMNLFPFSVGRGNRYLSYALTDTGLFEYQIGADGIPQTMDSDHEMLAGLIRLNHGSRNPLQSVAEIPWSPGKAYLSIGRDGKVFTYAETGGRIETPARSEAREIDMNDPSAIKAEIGRLEQLVVLLRQTINEKGNVLPAGVSEKLKQQMDAAESRLASLQERWKQEQSQRAPAEAVDARMATVEREILDAQARVNQLMDDAAQFALDHVQDYDIGVIRKEEGEGKYHYCLALGHHHLTDTGVVSGKNPLEIFDAFAQLINFSEDQERRKDFETAWRSEDKKIQELQAELARLRAERERILGEQINNRSEMRTSKREEVKGSNEHMRAVRSVALRAMRGIFGGRVVEAMGTAWVLAVLETSMPELFRVHQVPSPFFSVLKIPNQKIESEPVRILRIYSSLPDLESPEIQVLVDFAARVPMASLILQVSAAGHENLRRLELDLQSRISAVRKKTSMSAKGIKLRVIDSQKILSGNLSDSVSRMLVYSDDLAAIENIGRRLRQKGGHNVLLVKDDVAVQGDSALLRRASALLAALDELYSTTPLPHQMMRAMDLVNRRMDIFRQVQQMISTSA